MILAEWKWINRRVVIFLGGVEAVGTGNGCDDHDWEEVMVAVAKV